jgi:hypothetical protein
VRFGVEATAQSLRAEHADGIVLATGAVAPATTSLALGGAYDGGVPAVGTIDAVTAASDPRSLGRRIAVVDADGTAYATGIVLMLLPHVGELELVTPFETAFPHIGAGYDRPLLLERLAAYPGFRRRAAHHVRTIGPGAVTVADTLGGETTILGDLDAVVAIEPRVSVGITGVTDAVATELAGPPASVVAAIAPRVVTIGDAFAPRTIDAAIFDAVELAYDVAGLAALRG